MPCGHRISWNTHREFAKKCVAVESRKSTRRATEQKHKFYKQLSICVTQLAKSRCINASQRGALWKLCTEIKQEWIFEARDHVFVSGGGPKGYTASLATTVLKQKSGEIAMP
jgi:hypothetical protein